MGNDGDLTKSDLKNYVDAKARIKFLKESKEKENKENDLLELTEKVEKFISSLDDFEMRNIFTLFYMKGLTWAGVSHKMNSIYTNRTYTENSCRKKHERYLKKILVTVSDR